MIVAPQQLGAWSVTASADDGAKASLGFSVNPPLSETQFAPLAKPDLDRLFGKAKYALADDADEPRDRAIKDVRVGHEMFPWLMA